MNQWSITGLGMGTVFLALIALAIVVSLFPLVFRGKSRPARDPAPLPQITDRDPGAALRTPGADPRLVAVIVAAIAASTGMSPGQFRVTQIAAAPGQGGINTPVWAWADRIARVAHVR